MMKRQNVKTSKSQNAKKLKRKNADMLELREFDFLNNLEAAENKFHNFQQKFRLLKPNSLNFDVLAFHNFSACIFMFFLKIDWLSWSLQLYYFYKEQNINIPRNSQIDTSWFQESESKVRKI